MISLIITAVIRIVTLCIFSIFKVDLSRVDVGLKGRVLIEMSECE